jgi:ABC-2 type transport system permease protein
VMMQALNYMNMSEQYKASWVYYAMPLDRPGVVMGGAFKAIWAKYFLPFFIVISAFVLSVWGIGAISDILLALSNVTLFALLWQLAMRHLPFSQMEQVSNAGGRTLRTLFAFGVAGLMGVGHYFTLHIWILKGLFFVLSVIALWFVWDSYSKTNWEQVKMAENI